MRHKNLLFLILFVCALSILLVGCGESMERNFKSFTSEFGGGLNRALTVYDYNGNAIKSYEGRFDIQADDAGKILFDLNGKRTIIHGGIVIIDEI